MKNPKVSVIVICYNQRDTIGRALDSVLAQEDCDYEVIIGDDASADGTREVCEEYARRYPGRVRLMPAAPNKGVVDNYFDCFDAARGEYVADCAGDDYWLGTRRLAEMCGVLDSRSNVNTVYSDFEILDLSTGKSRLASTDPEYSRWLGGDTEGRSLLADILGHIGPLPYLLSASVYRKKALMEVYGKHRHMVRNRAFGCEDLPVMAALARSGAAAYLPMPTMSYSVGGETITHNRSVERQLGFYCATLEASRVLGEFYGVDQAQMAEMFRAKSRYMANMAFKSRRHGLVGKVADTVGRWRLSVGIKTKIYLLLGRIL